MNHKKLDLSAPDAEVVDSLEKLGYVPPSKRTDLINRIVNMKGDNYDRAMQLFDRFDNDRLGNLTPSPISYLHANHYD